jgi:hypothetical protein
MGAFGAAPATAAENTPGPICPGDESGLASDAVKWQRKNKGCGSDDNQSGDSKCGEKHDFRMGWIQKGMLLGGQLSGERSVAYDPFILMPVADHHGESTVSFRILELRSVRYYRTRCPPGLFSKTEFKKIMNRSV